MADRRQFLEQTSLAVVAAGWTSFAGPANAAEKQEARSAERGEIPIVDTHQHLWDLRRFRLPWVKKGSALDRNYLMSDYLEATAGLGIDKTIYMEVDVEPSQQQGEAEYVIELSQRADNPMVAAVISGRPASEGFARYITRFRDSAVIKGIRQVLHGPTTPAGYCLDPAFLRGIRLLGELGKSFDLCLRPAELADGTKLVDACPDTRFILDHCGNADVQAKDQTPWRHDMAEMARRKQVVCKVSGIVASALPGVWTTEDLAPIVNHTLSVFGPDRVMLGGDWPVCTRTATYRQWLEALQAIVRERPEEEQRKLFHDNAMRVYGLS